MALPAWVTLFANIRGPEGPEGPQGPEGPPPSEAVMDDVADAAIARLLTSRSVHLEGDQWVWDGPDSTAATHYLVPDHTGALVVRTTLFPMPSATEPALDW